MKASIDNQSKFPLGTVRAVVRWTLDELDANMPILGVRVRETKESTHHGRFHGDAPDNSPRVWADSLIPFPREVKHLMVCFVPRNPWGLHYRGFKTGPPAIRLRDWKESLVCIVAHEATHLHQYLRQGKPLFSEVEAEWAEYRLLRRWITRR